MKKQADIALLLVVLVSLSASIGILHGRKIPVDPSIVATDSRIVLEHQDALDYVQPYLISGNMDSTAAALHQFVDPVLFNALDDILSKVQLSQEQKVHLLASALLYDPDLHRQKMILTRLFTLFSEYPIFQAMWPHYVQAIPMVMGWAKKTRQKKQLARWRDQSLNQALVQDDPALLAGLYNAGIRPKKDKASQLLYQVATEGKEPEFVPFLVDQLKADINMSPDGMWTPLMRAVQKNNAKMVRVLLDQGADAELILNPKVGSARQIAFERGYSPIELMMKKSQ